VFVDAQGKGRIGSAVAAFVAQPGQQPETPKPEGDK
jgi:hypothetical protein